MGQVADRAVLLNRESKNLTKVKTWLLLLWKLGYPSGRIIKMGLWWVQCADWQSGYPYQNTDTRAFTRSQVGLPGAGFTLLRHPNRVKGHSIYLTYVLKSKAKAKENNDDSCSISFSEWLSDTLLLNGYINEKKMIILKRMFWRESSSL